MQSGLLLLQNEIQGRGIIKKAPIDDERLFRGQGMIISYNVFRFSVYRNACNATMADSRTK